MAFVIRKRVNLDFLGEEYNESYLLFKAVPLDEQEKLQDELESVGENEKDALVFIRKILKDKFLNGKCIDENDKLTDVTVDDFMSSVDFEVAQECLFRLLGVKQDPKSLGQ